MEPWKQSTGISRFVPVRLQIARQAKRLRQSELATMLSKSAATLSKWESHDYDHAPDDADILRLAEALSVAPSWFFLAHTSTQNAAFFRSLRGELNQARDRVEARLSFLEAIYDALQQFIEFPEIDIPLLADDADFRSFRQEDIESFASNLRDHWGIGDDPVDHLLLLIENAGIAVGEDVFDSAKLDGISKWTAGNAPLMLLAQDKNVAVRRRFDAAHELGHIYMHRRVRRADVAENIKVIEDQAMAFAGAFLLPAAPFTEDAEELSLDRLADIKPKWKVSVGAMIKRLGSLNLISAEHERNLWKHYSYRRWRGFEPFDDMLEVERPENIKAAIELVAADGPSHIRDFQSEVGLLGKDISELSGVDQSLFTSALVERRRIPLRPLAAADGSNIIDFPVQPRKAVE